MSKTDVAKKSFASIKSEDGGIFLILTVLGTHIVNVFNAWNEGADIYRIGTGLILAGAATLFVLVPLLILRASNKRKNDESELVLEKGRAEIEASMLLIKSQLKSAEASSHEIRARSSILWTEYLNGIVARVGVRVSDEIDKIDLDDELKFRDIKVKLQDIERHIGGIATHVFEKGISFKDLKENIFYTERPTPDTSNIPGPGTTEENSGNPQE